MGSVIEEQFLILVFKYNIKFSAGIKSEDPVKHG